MYQALNYEIPRVLVSLTQPTPKARARSSEILDQQIDGTASQQKWQPQINKYPPNYPKGQTGFFQAIPHHGLVLFALTIGFQHAEILGA